MKINISILIFFVSLFFNSQASALGGPKSGIYEQVFLVVEESGDVFGYYREYIDDLVPKKCNFFFSGKLLEGRRAKIYTWSNIKLPGEVRFDAGGIVLQVDRGGDHLGCGMVLPPEIQVGLYFSMVSEKRWKSLKVVTGGKVSVYKSPDFLAKTKKYLIRGDVVGVLSKNGDWIEFEYVDVRAKSTIGWVPSSDVIDINPPK